MVKWSIEKRVALCGKCESEFSEGAPLYSLLVTDEDVLQRLDICAQCRTDEACTAALFWWRTKFHEKKKRGLQLDLEAIEVLFIALADTERERLKELRYLMCLILLRKRRVKVVKVVRSHNGVEGEFFLVKRPRRDEQLAVQVFDFDGGTMDSLRDDLKNIFEGADPNELGAEEPASGAASEGGEQSDSTEVNGEIDSQDSEVAQEVAQNGTEGTPEGEVEEAPKG